MLKLFVALFVVSAVVKAACVSDPGGLTEQCGVFRTSLSSLDRMSQAEKLFNPNEPITFELSISNTQNAPATLTAGSSCTAVVFEVTDSAQRRQWGNADNIACIQMLQPRTFAPLEVISEAATWDQLGRDDSQVPPGTYTVSAAVGQFVSDTDGLVDCRVPLSQSATFTIR
jgi:hypothetical protein